MAFKPIYWIAASCLILGACRAMPSSRILEGDNTEIAETPWVAQVRVNNAHVGVGSIIGEQFVITAAHILYEVDPSSITLRVGSSNQFSGGQLVSVKAVHKHSKAENFLNDLAILELSEPLDFTDRIVPIEIVADDAELAEGSKTLITGWGLNSDGISPYKLQQTDKLTVLSPANCEYEAGFGYVSILCLQHNEGEGTCRGDEGAGVVIDNKLHGVISFSFGKCGTRFPDVASRLSQYLEWIDSIINPVEDPEEI